MPEAMKTDPACQLRVSLLIVCVWDRETSFYTRRICSTGNNRSGFWGRRPSVKIIVSDIQS